MALLRIDTRDHEPSRRSGRVSLGSVSVFRWMTLPGAAAGFALWAVTALSGAYSATAPATSATSFLPHLPQQAAVGSGIVLQPVVRQGKTGRLAAAAPAAATNVSVFPKRTLDERFETVVAAAALSPGKLAAVFGRAGLTRSGTQHAAPARERFEVAAVAAADHAKPETNRFGPGPAESLRSSRLALALSGSSDIELAYATPSPLPAAAAFDAVLLAPQDEAALDMAPQADQPLFSELPDNIPVPLQRPRLAAKPAEAAEPAKEKDVAAKPAEAPAKPAARQAKTQMVAFAKPDNPTESGGLAGAFRNLFSPKPKRPRAGVAIYDISAAKVYMPDGSVLEAHSGIGEMADNPRYVNQKMRGPTPPDTYNLSMRESLFHGVQALRMTPVDGKVGYNRSGILAHSYLLRGGRAESHGCVAFKDYPKFLKAFKQGKVRQLVVVPGSRGKLPPTAVAQNGRGA